MSKVNNKQITYFTPICIVSIVNFEQVKHFSISGKKCFHAMFEIL